MTSTTIIPLKNSMHAGYLLANSPFPLVVRTEAEAVTCPGMSNRTYVAEFSASREDLREMKLYGTMSQAVTQVIEDRLRREDRLDALTKAWKFSPKAASVAAEYADVFEEWRETRLTIR